MHLEQVIKITIPREGQLDVTCHTRDVLRRIQYHQCCMLGENA